MCPHERTCDAVGCLFSFTLKIMFSFQNIRSLNRIRINIYKNNAIKIKEHS